MEKATTIWLCIAAFLVVLGLVLFTVVMTLNHWDFTRLETVKYETNTHLITDDFHNITIHSDTAMIRFVSSKDGSCTVVCEEAANEKHTVSVQDGTLTVYVTNTKKWYEYISINFRTPRITVALPEEAYGSVTIKDSTGNIEIPKDFTFEAMDVSVSTGAVTSFASASGSVKIKTGTGNIRLEGISAQGLELAVSTGKITVTDTNCSDALQINVSTGKADLRNVTCKSLRSSGSTGDIILNNVIAEDRFSIDRTTGDVVLDGCDAYELSIKTSTGDVEGSLLSEKLFLVQTSTGSVRVPQTTAGGRCEITTSTGDIELEIQ